MLENTRRVDTVLLDKTGTVTDRAPPAARIAVRGRRLQGRGPDGRRRGRAGQRAPDRPSGRRRSAAGPPRPLPRSATSRPTRARAPRPGSRTPGGRRQGRALRAGVARGWLEHAETQAGTAVFVGWDGRAQAALTVEDRCRSSRAAIARLRELGLTPYLLTGDSATNAAQRRRAGGHRRRRTCAPTCCPPTSAASWTELQRSGRVVAIVGDGVNDAAALARRTSGWRWARAPTSPWTPPTSCSCGPTCDAVADGGARCRARRCASSSRTSFWAFGYNAAAIPLAALGLLNPMIAGATMALSSVLVVTDSLRLKRFGRWGCTARRGSPRTPRLLRTGEQPPRSQPTHPRPPPPSRLRLGLSPDAPVPPPPPPPPSPRRDRSR